MYSKMYRLRFHSLCVPTKKVARIKGSSIIVIIFTSVHSVRWGGGGQERSYAFLNVVYSDGNEIIAHVQRTSMTKN